MPSSTGWCTTPTASRCVVNRCANSEAIKRHEAVERDKTGNTVGRRNRRSSFLGHPGAEFFFGKSEKRSPGEKLWKRRAKNALGNQKTISTFRTASTTTSLTIVITF